MRIGHFQCTCPEWDFQRNLNNLQHGLEQAADARLDLLSFPESSLTGYYRTEEAARKNAFTTDSAQMRTVLDLTGKYDMTVIVGVNELREDQLYNSAAVIESGQLIGTYSKMFLIFKYFTPGTDLPVFECKGLKFGIVICADGSYIEPCRILALKGARLIVAPHWNYVDDPLDHCLHARRSHTARAVENAAYYMRGNNTMPRESYGKLVDGVPYYGYGDSYVIDPRGEVVAGAGMHDETLMIYNLDPHRYVGRPDRPSRSLLSAQRLLDQLNEVVGQGVTTA